MYRNDIKKVRFFRDGDANFSGVSIAISRARYRNFDSLLNDLSRKVPLPFGVRTLHTPGGVHHVYDIDQIEDGKDYVCSTFHSRPIKRLNYAGSTNKNSWRPAPRKMDSQVSRSDRQNEPGEKLFQTRNLKPKSITVIAKDDASNRARVILNRRTAMTYESVLQTVSDILQLNNGPVKDLYTIEGKKVGGIADLVHGPDVFLATGRNSGSVSARSMPSRLLKSKKANSGLLNVSTTTHSKSAVGPWRKEKAAQKKSPYTQPIFAKKKEKDKPKGNVFVFTVKTTDLEDAGTKGKVSVVVCGSKGSTGELTLGPPSSKKFEPGSREEFEMNIGTIGKVKKLRVLHSSEEENDDEEGWHLDEILMTGLSKSGEEYLFKCGRWFSKKDEDDMTVVELPAIVKNKEVAKVISYEVTVMTGDLPRAATDASVFIIIYGDAGDTGKRWLKNSNDSQTPFQKGNIDVFEVDAVCLGNLTKILIGHDNKGNTPGWYLEKVIIKDREENKDYSFPCRRFLDEDEGDGKTETTIKASLVSDANLTAEQLWKANEWKFQDSNELTLVSVLNGNSLRIDDANGEAIADENNDQIGVFHVTKGGEATSRIFTMKTKKHDFNLTLDEGTVSGRKGNPGLLSEFYIAVAEDNSVTLESVVHKGEFVSVTETGKVQSGDGTLGEQNRFNVSVKGSFRNLGRVKLRTFNKNQIVIENDGNLYGDGENDDDRGEFVVHKIGPGARAFQSAATDKFVNVRPEEICCKGEDKDDEECQFKVHKDMKKGIVRLESIKMPGVFLGICATGRVKHAVDAGDATASLGIDIISLGERSQKSPSPEKYDSEDDFEKEETDDGRSSGRMSRASQSSKEEEKEEDGQYQEDDFENEGSRSASQRSGSRSSTRASSRRGSAASSRKGSRASTKAGSRPTSRKSASRAESAASHKSGDAAHDQNDEDPSKEQEGAEERPTSNASKKTGSRPGTSKSESKDLYGTDDDDFENDSEGEEDKEAGGENADEGSRPRTAQSRKTSSRNGSAREGSRMSVGKEEAGSKGDEEEKNHEDKEVESKDDGEGNENDERSLRTGNVESRNRSAAENVEGRNEDDAEDSRADDEGDNGPHEDSASRPMSAASRKSSAIPATAGKQERASSSLSAKSSKDETTKEEQIQNEGQSSRPSSSRSSRKELRSSSRASSRRQSRKTEKDHDGNDAMTNEPTSSRPSSKRSVKASSRPSSSKTEDRPASQQETKTGDIANGNEGKQDMGNEENEDSQRRDEQKEPEEPRSETADKEENKNEEEKKEDHESKSAEENQDNEEEKQQVEGKQNADEEVAEKKKADDAELTPASADKEEEQRPDQDENNGESEEKEEAQNEADDQKRIEELKPSLTDEGEHEEEGKEGGTKENDDKASNETQNEEPKNELGDAAKNDNEHTQNEADRDESGDTAGKDVEERPNEINDKVHGKAESDNTSNEENNKENQGTLSRQGSSKRGSRPSSQKSKAGVYEGLVSGQSPPVSRSGSAASVRSKPSSSRGSRNSAKKKEENDAGRENDDGNDEDSDSKKQEKKNEDADKSGNGNESKEDLNSKTDTQESAGGKEEIKEKEDAEKEDSNDLKEDEVKENDNQHVNEEKGKEETAPSGNKNIVDGENTTAGESRDVKDKEVNEEKEKDMEEEKKNEGEDIKDATEAANEEEDKEIGEEKEKAAPEKHKIDDEEDNQTAEKSNDGEKDTGYREGDKTSEVNDKEVGDGGNNDNGRKEDENGKDERVKEDDVEKGDEKADDAEKSNESSKEIDTEKGAAEKHEGEEEEKSLPVDKGEGDKDGDENDNSAEKGSQKEGDGKRNDEDDEKGAEVQNENQTGAVPTDDQMKEDQNKAVDSDEGSAEKAVGKSGTNTPTNSPTSRQETAENSPVLSPTPPKTPRNSLTARRPTSRLSNPSGSKTDLRASNTSPSSLENGNDEKKDNSKDEDGEDSSGKKVWVDTETSMEKGEDNEINSKDGNGNDKSEDKGHDEEGEVKGDSSEKGHVEGEVNGDNNQNRNNEDGEVNGDKNNSGDQNNSKNEGKTEISEQSKSKVGDNEENKEKESKLESSDKSEIDKAELSKGGDDENDRKGKEVADEADRENKNSAGANGEIVTKEDSQ